MRRSLSAYKIMWLFVFFDLPVNSAAARRHYAQFRKNIMSLGFDRIQYSVYARAFPSEEAAKSYRQKIRAALPPEGMVSLLTVTDRQFGKMENYVGKSREKPRKPREQLLLF